MFDILAVCLILGLSLSIAVIFRRKIEECIPVVVLSISTILFLSGMLNSLLVGLYIIWALSLISLLYFIINYRKISLIDIATSGLLYFVGIFAISLLWHRYRVVKTWDELAQWALTVKNSFELDKFATVIESNAIYRDYPPASGLFHYFWMKVGNLFIDSRLYISM